MTNSINSADKNLALSLWRKTLGFRDCLPSTLDALVQAGHIRAYGKGAVVVHRGDPFDALCLILQGSVETSLNPKDGHRHLIGYLQAGDVFGLISVIDRKGHVNDMCARETKTAILHVQGDQVRKLRAVDAKLIEAFEAQLAFRSRLMYERLDTRPGVDLATRLARMVLAQVQFYDSASTPDAMPALKLSQSDFADLLGVTRQRVNSAIKQLKDLGLIEVNYSVVRVPDSQKLQVFADRS